MKTLFIIFAFCIYSPFLWAQEEETYREITPNAFRVNWGNISMEYVPTYLLSENYASWLSFLSREKAQWNSPKTDTLKYKRYGLYGKETADSIYYFIGYEWVAETAGEQIVGTVLDGLAMSGFFQRSASAGLMAKVPVTAALVETTIQIWRNGQLVTENAKRIGSLGHSGTKSFVDAKNAIEKGGNFIIKDKQKAIELLEKAFIGILDETSKTTSKFGYRIDDFKEIASKSGLKQGHQGLHINFYDKVKGVRGTIIIE
jgi:hypothetical protein